MPNSNGKLFNQTAGVAPIPKGGNTITFWVLAVASIFLSHLPLLSLLFTPINVFTTAVHELGHAIVCLLTGGHVSGLTIVSDGVGHGGLTFCLGGAPLLYAQSGYLGAAFFGCVLIYLSQYPSLSRPLLLAMGAVMSFATVFLVPGSVLLPGHFMQGVGSLFFAGLMSVALIWCGLKLKTDWANLLVLFLAIQTALNSLTSFGDLVSLTFGLAGMNASSDASGMAMMTGIPAFVWSVLWAGISIVMVWFTFTKTYGKWLFKPKAKA